MRNISYLCISEKDFLARMEYFRKENATISFMGADTFADMVLGELRDAKVEAISEKPEYSDKSISDLEKGTRGANISGRVISISNPRSFKTRKGGEGKVCNVELKDNTGTMRTVFWTPNIKLLKNVNEGDIIQIKNVDIKEGYSGLEANLVQRSTVVHLEEDPSKFPAYEEDITNIADIQPDTKVNIIARIVRIPTVRSYEKNGKQGKVASLELKDATGEISYTLWNNNVDLIENLKLEDGDSVKILQAQARQRANRDGEMEISLTHWDGRIIKGEYDVSKWRETTYREIEEVMNREITSYFAIATTFYSDIKKHYVEVLKIAKQKNIDEKEKILSHLSDDVREVENEKIWADELADRIEMMERT